MDGLVKSATGVVIWHFFSTVSLLPFFFAFSGRKRLGSVSLFTLAEPACWEVDGQFWEIVVIFPLSFAIFLKWNSGIVAENSFFEALWFFRGSKLATSGWFETSSKGISTGSLRKPQESPTHFFVFNASLKLCSVLGVVLSAGTNKVIDDEVEDVTTGRQFGNAVRLTYVADSVAIDANLMNLISNGWLICARNSSVKSRLTWQNKEHLYFNARYTTIECRLDCFQLSTSLLKKQDFCDAQWIWRVNNDR